MWLTPFFDVNGYCEAAGRGWLEDVMAVQSRSDFASRGNPVLTLGADELTFGRMRVSLP